MEQEKHEPGEQSHMGLPCSGSMKVLLGQAGNTTMLKMKNDSLLLTALKIQVKNVINKTY
jgi:hypothetical protein